MRFLGFNDQMPDLDCAVGLSQLRKLPGNREPFGFSEGDFPVAEGAYARLLILPRSHGSTDDVEVVSLDVERVLGHCQRAERGAA